MVLTHAVTNLGRTAANNIHDACRRCNLFFYDRRYFLRDFRVLSDDKGGNSLISIAGQKLREKLIELGKFNEKSINVVVLVSDGSAVRAKSMMNKFDILLCRHWAKGLFNTTPFLNPSRGLCTLYNPTKKEEKKNSFIMNQVRFRGDQRCADWCGVDPCSLNRKESNEKPSMWVNPDCITKAVCERPFRYDIIYMPGSNKETREYQRTWAECPPPVPKMVCCIDKVEDPPICRRPRTQRPSTATHVDVCKDAKMKGKCIIKPVEQPGGCPKFDQLPCCDVVKNKSCKIYPTPSCCRKRCTPFPSFSECCRPELKQNEDKCNCFAIPTVCEIYAAWRKQNQHKLPEVKKFLAFPE